MVNGVGFGRSALVHLASASCGGSCDSAGEHPVEVAVEPIDGTATAATPAAITIDKSLGRWLHRASPPRLHVKPHNLV